MGQTSTIEWTDATWNPTTGCDRISAGCANCYAKTIHDRRHKAYLDGWTDAPRQYHQPFEVVQTRDDRLTLPLRWQEPRRIFVDSMSDLFHEAVSDEFVDKVFAVMALTPRHTFQVLTKRADRMLAYMTGEAFERVSEMAMSYQYAGNFDDSVEFDARDAHENMSAFWPLPNVWLGVSVENQHFADERIPLLLQTPAAVRFISAEPLLGPIDLTNVRLSNGGRVHALGGTVVFDDPPDGSCFRGLDLVIVGGESDKDARPFDLMWGRGLVEQCHAAGVAIFVKQVGAKAWDSSRGRATADHRTHVIREHGRAYIRLKHPKGGDMAEWPEDLRVREMPAVRS